MWFSLSVHDVLEFICDLIGWVRASDLVRIRVWARFVPKYAIRSLKTYVKNRVYGKGVSESVPCTSISIVLSVLVTGQSVLAST